MDIQPKDEGRKIQVRIVDATDKSTEETALTSGDFTVTVAKADTATSMTAYTPTSVVNKGNGIYLLDIPSGAFDTEGETVVRVAATGAEIYADKYRVYDKAAYLAEIAATVLTMTFTDALANSVNMLPASPHNDYRETLIGAAKDALVQEFDGSNNIKVSLPDGTHIFTINMVSATSLANASLITKTG